MFHICTDIFMLLLLVYGLHIGCDFKFLELEELRVSDEKEQHLLHPTCAPGTFMSYVSWWIMNLGLNFFNVFTCSFYAHECSRAQLLFHQPFQGVTYARWHAKFVIFSAQLLLHMRCTLFSMEVLTPGHNPDKIFC